MNWVRYPQSKATWEPFENLSGKEASEYQVILFIQSQYLSTSSCYYSHIRRRGLGNE